MGKTPNRKGMWGEFNAPDKRPCVVTRNQFTMQHQSVLQSSCGDASPLLFHAISRET